MNIIFLNFYPERIKILSMELMYIYHSGFVISTSSCNIIIDYYKDPANIIPSILKQTEKKLYVLCSHFHADHYNTDILFWKNVRQDIVYVFSNDIKKHKKIVDHSIHFLKKGDIYTDGILRIVAFGSTDIGISFLIYHDNYTIFHAGDLNNWHWKDESTPNEIRKSEGDYLKELSDLRKEIKSIDLVMFPVDSRLGTDYALGAKQFLDKVQVKIFSPMHFWEDYKAVIDFALIAKDYNCRYISWQHPGEVVIW